MGNRQRFVSSAVARRYCVAHADSCIADSTVPLRISTRQPGMTATSRQGMGCASSLPCAYIDIPCWYVRMLGVGIPGTNESSVPREAEFVPPVE